MTKYGGIAQLGERLNGIQEVSGSIPLISTTSPENHLFSGLFLAVITNNHRIIRIFLDLFLHMLVMLRHIHICVPCQALNGFQWYALRLKLQNISVPAAMG